MANLFFKKPGIPKADRTLALILMAFLVLFISLPGVSAAQQAEQIMEASLTDLLELAEENNYRIQISSFEEESARAQFRQTNAVFLPGLSAEVSGITTTDPVNAFGFKLKQEAFTEADFNTDILNNPDRIDHFSTKFEVRQPLFNPDKMMQRSSIKSRYRAAGEMTGATRQRIRFQVKQSYYRLIVSIEQVNVLETALEAAREIRRNTENFFEQGLISRADYLSSEVRVIEIESDLLAAEDNIETLQDNLNFLLGIQDNLRILPSDSLSEPADATLREVRNGVFTGNSVIRALEFQKTAAEKQLQSGRFSFLPSINAFGAYEMNDDVLLGNQGDNFTIGATLRWNLFSGFEKAGKVMQSKAELNRVNTALVQKREEQKLEIRKAERMLQQAQKQLQLANISIEQTGEDFRIRSDRYEQGLEKTSDLLTAKAGLLRSRLQRLHALYNLYESMAVLEMIYENEWITE
ncbi:MAG: TolC family protein [Balneolaceae bacterium]